MALPTTAYLQIEKGSRDLLLKFGDPLHISGMFDARNFEFGTQIDHGKGLRTNAKFDQKDRTLSRDILFLHSGSLYISGTDKARKFKVGIYFEHESP